jgi:hypothetical protein
VSQNDAFEQISALILDRMNLNMHEQSRDSRISLKTIVTDTFESLFFLILCWYFKFVNRLINLSGSVFF